MSRQNRSVALTLRLWRRLRIPHTLRLMPCTLPDVRLRACALSAETTPQELIADGLYKALALAWYTDPFRQVSSQQVVRGKWCE